MALWEPWETIPFHFIWVSLTLLYGFRVWRVGPMLGVLGFVIVSTGTLILYDVHVGSQLGGELTEVPLMSAMFLAMVWHARRRARSNVSRPTRTTLVSPFAPRRRWARMRAMSSSSENGFGT